MEEVEDRREVAVEDTATEEDTVAVETGIILPKSEQGTKWWHELSTFAPALLASFSSACKSISGFEITAMQDSVMVRVATSRRIASNEVSSCPSDQEK